MTNATQVMTTVHICSSMPLLVLIPASLSRKDTLRIVAAETQPA